MSTIKSASPSYTNDIARDDAVRGPSFDLSADAILNTHHLLNINADRNLVVRAMHGDRALLEDAAHGVGSNLLDAAPELAERAKDLEALLAGRMPRMEIGLILRPQVTIGRYVWVQTVALRDAEGNVQGVNHMLADATVFGRTWERNERHRREAAALRHRVAQLTMEVALAQSELRGLDDAKSQFVAAAAHEMRNPLASLIGYLELLEVENPENLDDAQRHHMQGISRSAQRLRLLTNNLLDITRIDSNRLELTMTAIDPLELVEDAVSEMQPLFDAKQQAVFLKADQDLPQIWCDKLRAMQILSNLLSNAHKYTPEGGKITVQAGRQKQKPMVVLRVKDNGIGIPLDDQYHLFDRFYRASNAGAADGAGAGLGLSITHSLVRLHGGKLWFESKPGKGATFFVTFPIVE
jgi:signal transduction histidine kinase